MMKQHILFILENAAYPDDARVPAEAVAAVKFGYDVTVISPTSKRYPLKYERIDGVDIHRHPMAIRGRGKLAFLFEYANALFGQLFLAIRIYIKKPAHIIHAANPPDTIFLIALFFKILGTKYVFDHHDLSPELYLTRFSGKKDVLYRMLMLSEKLSCKLADAIISTNESYRRIVNRHDIDSEKTFVVRNDPMISECLVRAKADSKEHNDKKILLFVGGINPQDGVDVLLRALYYLVNDLDQKNFVCYIIGGGESLQSLKQTAKELDLLNFVDFKGWIFEREKIKEYLDLSDICVEPAPDNEVNRHSTFIKIMEYMAAARPIVAFDLIETRYSANSSAILVKPGDIIGFAKAINRLMDEPQLREELGKAGIERIKRELNWENALLGLEQAYNSLSL